MRRKAKPTRGPYLVHVELLRDRVPSFAKFPYCLPAVRNLERLAFHPKVTFFVGENGSGKSTLLEALAVSLGLNPEGGSRHFNFATRASHSDLDACLRVAKSLTLPRDTASAATACICSTSRRPPSRRSGRWSSSPSCTATASKGPSS